MLHHDVQDVELIPDHANQTEESTFRSRSVSDGMGSCDAAASNTIDKTKDTRSNQDNEIEGVLYHTNRITRLRETQDPANGGDNLFHDLSNRKEGRVETTYANIKYSSFRMWKSGAPLKI